MSSFPPLSLRHHLRPPKLLSDVSNDTHSLPRGDQGTPPDPLRHSRKTTLKDIFTAGLDLGYHGPETPNRLGKYYRVYLERLWSHLCHVAPPTPCPDPLNPVPRLSYPTRTAEEGLSGVVLQGPFIVFGFEAHAGTGPWRPKTSSEPRYLPNGNLEGALQVTRDPTGPDETGFPPRV